MTISCVNIVTSMRRPANQCAFRDHCVVFSQTGRFVRQGALTTLGDVLYRKARLLLLYAQALSREGAVSNCRSSVCCDAAALTAPGERSAGVRSPDGPRLRLLEREECAPLSRRPRQPTVTRRALPVLAAIALSSGCLPHALEKKSETPVQGKVQVRFLGVGGFMIRRDSDVIMTAPLYSNPDPGTLLLGEICPNRAVLDRYFVKHELGREMSDLRAVLVGHAHYDHLMDVPYFLEKAPAAVVYGSVTTRRLLAGYGPEIGRRVIALNDPAAARADFTNCGEPSADGCVRFPGQHGHWVDVEGAEGRVRVQAFCSRHPPQLIRAIHFWPGCQEQDLTSPPERADAYKEGEVFSFLVDFMEGARPAFRVYYQDAPVAKPVGWIPEEVIQERPVDLALLCAGTFDAVESPESIVSENLRAAAVVIHHWEDFFDATHSRLESIPGCDVDRFYTAVLARVSGDKSKVHILAPGVLRNFPRE